MCVDIKINSLSAAPCTELRPCIGGRAGGGEGSTGSGSGLSAHGAVSQCHGGLRAGHTHHCTIRTMGRAPVILAILLCLMMGKLPMTTGIDYNYSRLSNVKRDLKGNLRRGY